VLGVPVPAIASLTGRRAEPAGTAIAGRG
jgi:hypothetical protein